MQSRRTSTIKKKFLKHYGEQLVGIRYRYDEQRRKRFAIIEIVV